MSDEIEERPAQQEAESSSRTADSDTPISSAAAPVSPLPPGDGASEVPGRSLSAGAPPGVAEDTNRPAVQSVSEAPLHTTAINEDLPHLPVEEGTIHVEAPAPGWRGGRPRFHDRPSLWWVGALSGQRSTVQQRTTALAAAQGDPTAHALAAALPARRRPNRTRGAIALVLSVVLFVWAIQHALSSANDSSGTGSSALPATPPVAPGVAFSPQTGPGLAVNSVLGATALLDQPHEALALPGGAIVVANPAKGDLIVLGPTGNVVRHISSGAAPFISPFALAATKNGFYVLDAERNTLDLFDTNAHFVREIMHDPALNHVRGLAVGPDGHLYAANPQSNSVLVVSPGGAIMRVIHSSLGSGPGQFNQPSAVTVGSGGTLYVLDNVNNRIETFNANGTFLHQQAAPQSDTLFSAHMIALSSGQLLVSDPSGALLLYATPNTPPVRYALQLPLNASGPIKPVGIALFGSNRVLVTDAQGDRLLVTALP